ncbi:hypothetical protein J437_LFUL013373 [Ladona fulva]|uniref:Uncharacterized protein n=1 Tax=Ladona fulva TaxID=123851 RepID=A0A8K0KDK6_LADFU|nr:hypothetical protein J437_LFUL013373 [Ladona fulva]
MYIGHYLKEIMFYQYNNFTGRLTGTQSFQPYFPVNMKPVKGDTPEIVFADSHVTMAKESPPPRRGASGRPVVSIPEHLRQKQALFQRPDGVLIHLKGGPLDKGLFGLTIALCGVGLAMCGKLFYDLSVPKK